MQPDQARVGLISVLLFVLFAYASLPKPLVIEPNELIQEVCLNNTCKDIIILSENSLQTIIKNCSVNIWPNNPLNYLAKTHCREFGYFKGINDIVSLTLPISISESFVREYYREGVLPILYDMRKMKNLYELKVWSPYDFMTKNATLEYFENVVRISFHAYERDLNDNIKLGQKVHFLFWIEGEVEVECVNRPEIEKKET